MARPPSMETQTIRAHLRAVPPDRGASARELARTLQIGYDRTQDVIDRLARAGEAVIVARERVPGVKKPVARWVAAERLEAGRDPRAEAGGIFEVLTCVIVAL